MKKSIYHWLFSDLKQDFKCLKNLFGEQSDTSYGKKDCS